MLLWSFNEVTAEMRWISTSNLGSGFARTAPHLKGVGYLVLVVCSMKEAVDNKRTTLFPNGFSI